MKKINTLFILIPMLSLIACSKIGDKELTPNFSTGKMTKELTVNGLSREYIIYIPQNYSATISLPLLLSFHGLGSNMEFNYSYTRFDEIAERENLIVVYPNGIKNNWTLSSDNNPDIDFIKTLLAQLEDDYKIESKRIYSTGMSEGGFFSFKLACSLSNRITAVASVTGSMYQYAINNCFPSRPISVLQIHGTEDNIVPYTSTERLLDFWTSHNHTDTIPIISNIPDVDTNDGSTVQRFEYLNGDNDVEVQHLKIINGDHLWPGHRGNMDINASEEVWSFVKAFDLNGKFE